MKQLTILCSSDLADEVGHTLDRAGVEGFLRIPNAVGSKPGAAAEHGRVPRWEAEVFMAALPDGEVDRIVAGLREHADRCEVEPCLRILVSTLDAVY